MLKPERLIALRKSKKLYQKDVASAFGVDRTTYVKYETGVTQPPTDMLSKLADYFNVTTDYLLGKSDSPNSKSQYEEKVSSKRAAEIIQERLEGTPLVNPDGTLSERYAEAIVNFILDNSNTLQKLADEGTTTTMGQGPSKQEIKKGRS